MKIELPKKITRAGVNKVLRQLRANTRAHIKAEISEIDKRSVFARKQLESLLEDWPAEGADSRKFPGIQFGPSRPHALIETTDMDGVVRVDYEGCAKYSAYQIQRYVEKFCEINHLRA